MAGAVGVIEDVRTSIRNMCQLKDDLTEAETTADEHRRRIAEVRNKPRGYGAGGCEAVGLGDEGFNVAGVEVGEAALH